LRRQRVFRNAEAHACASAAIDRSRVCCIVSKILTGETGPSHNVKDRQRRG
jgi:hypothetical protein